MFLQFLFIVPLIATGDPRTIKFNPKSTLKKFDYRLGPMTMFDRKVRPLISEQTKHSVSTKQYGPYGMDGYPGISRGCCFVEEMLI